jgi:FecR protein
MLCVATVAHAQGSKKNPTSKLYVADLKGDVQIDTGVEIDDLTKKSVFNAAGTSIETKPASNASLVLSNGTGLYIDVNTRLDIKEFQQDAFRPNRTDVEDEPSISRTRLDVVHGVVGVSTSKLVAGSTLVCETALASASIRGRQTVILAQDNLTVISMVQGDATVQAGPLDRPRLVKNHQQIIIRPGKIGEANIVEVRDIDDGDKENMMKWLEDRVLTADASRMLVYFEVQARRSGTGADGAVTAFDGAGNQGPANAGNGGTPENGGTDGGTTNQIVAVPVVPSQPTVDTNVSPANLTSH